MAHEDALQNEAGGHDRTYTLIMPELVRQAGRHQIQFFIENADTSEE